MATEIADVNSGDMFEAAMADAPVETPQVEPPQPEQDGQPRDEHGRFATKPEDAPLAEKPVEKLPEERQLERIPLAEYLATRERAQKAESETKVERERREELERRFTALEQARREPPKPEEKPDPLLDPAAFTEYMERRFEERIIGERREMSLRMAHRTHREAFTEAYAAAVDAMRSGDHVLGMRMTSSNDPGETLIQWHREQKTMREVGNDPSAYRQKLLDEALKDPAYLAKAIEAAKASAANPQANGSNPIVRLPPSLANAARGDAHESSDLDMSNEGLFRYAMK